MSLLGQTLVCPVDLNKESQYQVRLIGVTCKALVAMARRYVSKHHLPWVIRTPRAWENGGGPHVTLTTKNGPQLPSEVRVGQIIPVTLVSLDHYSTRHNRWVVIKVKLPPRYSSAFHHFHVSIGQQKLRH